MAGEIVKAKLPGAVPKICHKTCLDQGSVVRILYFSKWHKLLLLLPLSPKYQQLGFIQVLLPPMPLLHQVLNPPVSESSANTDIRKMETGFSHHSLPNLISHEGI